MFLRLIHYGIGKNIMGHVVRIGSTSCEAQKGLRKLVLVVKWNVSSVVIIYILAFTNKLINIHHECDFSRVVVI
jgi:hypothetical protein